MPAKTTRRRDFARAGSLVVAAIALALAPAAAVQATVGSVPAVVADYAADPRGLVARLDDLFGVGASGTGLDLSGATVGELDRAFTWRDEFLAGESGPVPIALSNEWTATISVDDKPVGVATIFINPDSNAPDLADFTAGAGAGAAFAALPAGSSLVHDSAHAAWFTLDGTTLTPVVAGDSGVTKATTLSAYQAHLVAGAGKTPTGGGGSQGTLNSIIVIVVAVLAVGAIVFFTGRRRAAAPLEPEALEEPADSGGPGAPQGHEPTAEPAVEPEEPEATTVAPAKKKVTAKKKVPGKTPAAD